MAHVLSLLIPALIPSWRFFKAVEPSPRVQWCVGNGAWRDFRPRPASLSAWVILRRLVWNPHWNDTLYMVSLAERLTLAPDPATMAEIWVRLGREIRGAGVGPAAIVRFRLVFVSISDGITTSDITYQSARRPLNEIPG